MIAAQRGHYECVKVWFRNSERVKLGAIGMDVHRTSVLSASICAGIGQGSTRGEVSCGLGRERS